MNKLILTTTLLMFATSLQSQTMHIVNAGNYYYQPSELSINQGDSVRFINDNGYHDVVVTSGPENLSLPACSGPCDIGVLVFNTTGDYEYICSIGSHSSLGMVGTIVVNETDEIFQPQTNNELQTAVDLWVSDNATALATYGEINTWDVSLVTDMSGLFQDKSTFNDDIGNWDVSNVLDMKYMFKDAESFNQNLNSWDVSSVTNMNWMFAHQLAFNNGGLPLNWNTSNVTNMEWMFFASNFDQDISAWDVSNVTKMNQMFYSANFNQDISNWNVSSVTTMHRMFIQNGAFNQNISNWDVSNVTDFSGMFAQNPIFNQDISSWDVSSATNMSEMFTESGPLSNENRCEIHTAWSSVEAWPYDWSGFCTITQVFQPQTKVELQTAVDLWVSDNASALVTYGEINTWDVSLISDMANLFEGKTNFNDNIGNWDVSNVTDMNHMFAFCQNFNQDLNNWDLSNVTNTRKMFRVATNFNGDISDWNVSNVTNMTAMFSGAPSFNGDISSWDVSNVTIMPYMFDNADDFNGDISSWDVSSVNRMDHMFRETNFTGDISSWNTTNVVNMKQMFKGAAFNGDISMWNISNVTNTSQMFLEADNFNIDISNWDVSNVTNMTAMFDDALALSNENKCAIHTSWSTNNAWSYDWSGLCIPSSNNYSLLFEGESWVDFGNLNYISDGVPGEYTIVTNVKFNSVSGSQFIFGDERDGNNGVMMQLQSNLLATYFRPPGSYHSSDFSPTTDTDYNIVYRQNSSGMHIFVDGTLTGSFDGMNHSETGHNTGLGVFGVGQFNNRQFDGVMHDCIIYGEALDDAAIQSIMSEDAYPNSNNLYALYNFSTGSGDMVYDQSGNGHNGTLSGATWIEDDPLPTLTYVAIPDQNFEQKLIDLGYDDVLDGQVQSDNISEVTFLALNSANISDITGIEGFTLLQDFHCVENQITTLDLSQNTNLRYAHLRDNLISSINIANCSNLEHLDLNRNNLNSIDLSGNTNLKVLEISGIHDLSGTTISELDISNNPNLERLYCNSIQLTSLDLSNQPNLTTLHAQGNELDQTSLILNSNLEELMLDVNNFEELDLSALTNLHSLWVSGNPLSELDISGNSQLRNLNCANIQLTSLDVSNNPLIEWIQCSGNGISSLNLLNNINLRSLEVNGTDLTSIDLSNNTNLKYLYIHDNSLTGIDLSNNLMLTQLFINNAELSTLDVSNNDSLRYINAGFNQLGTLDLSNKTKLRTVIAGNNELENVSLFNSNNDLEEVFLGYNNLTSMTFDDMPKLRAANVQDNNLQSLSLKHGSSTFNSFSAVGNPDLECIEVLDVAYHVDRFSSYIDEGTVFNEECGPVALVNPESISEILYDHESVVRTLIISNAGEFPLEWQLSTDSEGSSELLSNSGCVDEYSDTDCGWGLVAFENAGFRQNLKYLGVDGIIDTDNAGNIGHLMEDYSGDVLIVAGDKYYKFASEENIFTNTVDPFIDLYDFESNDDQLNTWVEQDGGIKFCRGSQYPDVRPGDTSWGLIPNGSAQRDCGCNSGGWSGYGTYYGGFESGCTSCGCQGGGWTGTKASGQNKGNGGYANVDLAIYVRDNSDWLTTSVESGSVAPGQEVSVDVTINATGLSGGEYSSALFLTSNDNDNPEIVIPVELTVLETMVWGSLSDTSMAEDSELQIQLQLNTSDEYELSISSDTLALETNIIGNTLFLAPIENWNGSSTIGLTLNSNGDLLTDSFLLTVHEVNDAPIAMDETFDVDEDQVLSVTVDANDGDPLENTSDQQELNFTTITGFTNGAYEFGRNDGVLVYYPNENFHGLDTLVYLLMDFGTTSGQSDPKMDSATVIVEINPINDAPIIAEIEDQSTNEDEALNIALHPNDVDGDFLEVSAFLGSDVPVQLFVHSDGDSLLMVPGQDWFGDAVVTVTAHDGEYTAEESFNLQVLPVDDEPVVAGYLDDVYVYEDFGDYWEVNLNDIFLDIDGPLEFSAELSDAVIGFDINQGMLHLFPLENANGVAEMVITASNPVRASVSDTVLVTVFAVNDPPMVGSIETVYVTEDVPLAMWTMASLYEQGIISDVDNALEELEFALHYDHSLFHIEWSHNAQDAPMLYPHENHHGTTMATLCVYDGDYEHCSDFEVVVESVNDAPFFAMDMHQVVGLDLDFHMEIHYGDVDTDYEALELTLLSGPAWTHSLDGNHLFGMPTDLGYYPIALQLDDGMDTMVDTLHLHVEHFKPVITSVEDVPNDQGGRVYVSFNASYFDNGETNGQSYGLHRLEDLGNGEMEWVQLSSVDAIGDPAYTFEASTLFGFSEGNEDNYSLSFDGEDDYVSFETSVLPSAGDYTVQVWATHRGPTGNGFNHLVAQNESFYLGTDASNIIRASDHWGDTNVEYPLDIWTNIALVKSSVDLKMYIDGDLVAVQSGEIPNPPNEEFFIGKQFGDLAEHWFGNIHRVSVFNIALNQSEVSNYMDSHLIGSEEGLIGHWNFNEGSGDVLYDQTENGNNGTIHGATWSNNTPASSQRNEGWATFRIMASTIGGIFESNHEEGYSVDNIAPGVPEGLMAMVLEDGIELSWSPSVDDDFQYFLLEKSTDESFSASTAYELVDTTFMDVEYEMNQTYYYRVTAFDHAGNQSDFSDVVEAALLSAMEDLVPAEFALHQNYPNPFNPTTQIKFDLAEDGLVTIKIYDVMGRQLKTLVNSVKTAGYHSIRWDATNDLGEGVSAGMYIYMIQAGDFVSTRKMVLLK